MPVLREAMLLAGSQHEVRTIIVSRPDQPLEETQHVSRRTPPATLLVGPSRTSGDPQPS